MGESVPAGLAAVLEAPSLVWRVGQIAMPMTVCALVLGLVVALRLPADDRPGVEARRVRAFTWGMAAVLLVVNLGAFALGSAKVTREHTARVAQLAGLLATPGTRIVRLATDTTQISVEGLPHDEHDGVVLGRPVVRRTASGVVRLSAVEFARLTAARPFLAQRP